MDFLRSANIAWINRTVASTAALIQTTMAAIYAYMSAVWAGTEDPLWPHLILIPASVLAGIAVGVGIVFERPKCSEKFHKIGFWCVVAGIAVECVCTVLLFGVDERISNAQQSKIISLETRLVALAPRTQLLQGQNGLNPKFIGELRAFAGQKVETFFCASPPPHSSNDPPYFVDDEAIGFAMLLAGALQDAGWEAPFATNRDCRGTGGRGVFIYLGTSASEKAKKAADGLLAAIRELPTPAGIISPAPQELPSSDSLMVLVLSHPM